METRTQDLLFGTGRTSLGQAMAIPDEPVKFRDLVGTMRGREQVDKVLRSQLPSRASDAANLLGDVDPTRSLMAPGAAASGAAAVGTGPVEYANPIYHGLYAQSLMRNHGFVPPVAAGSTPTVADAVEPAVRSAVGDATTSADSPIRAAADDVAAGVAELEQRMLGALQRLGELPSERQVAALAKAVDATAQHGGDTYEVLARTITERPLEDAAVALERGIDDAAKVVAPVADDAARVADDAARVTAPVVDDVAKVAKAAKAAAPRIAPASDDALRGLMSFKAGLDDTLRMLARI